MLECVESEWDILEPLVLHPNKHISSFAEQVLDLSQQAAGFHLLFVHTDADAPDEDEKAMPRKIRPAQQALDRIEPVGGYCRFLVPVIPVVKIENWKLADSDALRGALGTLLPDETLGLNIGSKQLEEKNASKELLSEVLQRINEGRRVPVTLEDLDAALAKNISLKRMYRFKSFQKFVERLKAALVDQNIIKSDCSPKFIN